MYFIKPEMTGKGVGREIVSLLENDAKLHGMKKLVVDISDENEKRKGEKTACRLVKFFIERDSGKDYGIYK